MGLMTSLFGATVPSEYRGPVAWLNDVGSGRGGVRAASGEMINAENSLTLSAVFASVRVIAEDVAKLPIGLFERLEPRGRRRMFGHDLDMLVSLEPNDEMIPFSFFQMMVAHAVLWGSGYAHIEREGGRPVSIMPIYSSRVRIKRDEDGRLYYEIAPEPGSRSEPEIVRPRDMIHIQGFSTNGLAGLAMSQHAANAFGIYMAAERFSGSFFANGAITSGMVEFPGKADAGTIDVFREQFKKRYSGAENSWLPVVLPGGATYKPDTVDPEKGRLVETLKFRIEDTARWFRVPPHKIGDLERATFSNIEHQSLEYQSDTIMPWLIRCEQELNRKLLSIDDRRTLYFKINADAILRMDAKARAEANQIKFRNGVITQDEWREDDDKNPIPGDLGDVYFVTRDLVRAEDAGLDTSTVDQTGQPNGPPDGPDEADDDADETEGETGEADPAAIAMPAFVDAAERMILREINAITRKKDPDAEWFDKFYAKHHDEVEVAFRAPVAVLARMVGVDAEGVTVRYADHHVAESRRRIEAGESVSDWARARPAEIAEYLTNEVTHA